MARGIAGGVAGWLAAALALAVANGLAVALALGPDYVPLAGLGGLLAAVALAGVVAGLVGGRRAGAGSSAIAGVIAGALIVGCLYGLMYALQTQDKLPYLLALHPVRADVAVAFIGCLVAVIAFVIGSFAGRGASDAQVAVAPGARLGASSGPRDRSSAGVPRQPQPTMSRPYGQGIPSRPASEWDQRPSAGWDERPREQAYTPGQSSRPPSPPSGPSARRPAVTRRQDDWR